MISVEKFPDLEWRGRRLVWDSRQSGDGRPELVFIPEGAKPEVVAALKSRANSEVAGADLSLGECAAESLGFPSAQLTVVAVTGTNGKTTTTQILRTLLVAAGCSTAEIGTLGLAVYDPLAATPRFGLETGFTTPDAPTLHHLFKQFVDSGVSHVVMEASSHAMSLGRIAGCDFDAAIFTNLSQDHLDFHGSMAAYETAKASLFSGYLPRAGSRKKKLALLNSGDAAGRRLLAGLPLGITALAYERDRTFGLERASIDGLALGFDDGSKIASKLVGTYNAENLAAAWIGARWLLARDGRLSRENEATMADTLARYGGPTGRMERVPDARAPARHVFVDYAHTPDALEKALTVLSSARTPYAKLLVVFGCGGDRDRSKRPLMGAAAAKIADRVILTSDNPRTEEPGAILREIESGIPGDAPATVKIIADRDLAIRSAIGEMNPGDVCLVAGKGHETYQIIGAEKRPFSDFEVCRSALV